MALVIYGNWRMLGYSPQMDWQFVVDAGVVQDAGLGILLPTLTKAAFSTLDPIFRPEGTALFNLSRLYGSSIGVALVLFHARMYQLIKCTVVATVFAQTSAGSIATASVTHASKALPMTFYRTVQVNGLSIFYRKAGRADAATLLLLHGFPSSSRMYEPLLARLSAPPLGRRGGPLWFAALRSWQRRGRQ
jgi:hypothetical protein